MIILFKNKLNSIFALFSLPVFIGIGCIAINPIGFQKSISLTTSSNSKFDNFSMSSIDLASTMAVIPYKDGSLIYDVLPLQKYKKTVLDGYGNCSNLIFGFAYLLRKNSVNYNIVHIMSNNEYLTGIGHTIIDTKYSFNGIRNNIGLIDVSENAIPTKLDGTGLSLEDIRTNQSPNVKLIKVGENRISSHLFYYEQSYLSRSTIGVMRGDEVNSYMNFIEAIYFPLGSRILEKYAYDGLAIFFGYYPKIYVENYKGLNNIYYYSTISKIYLYLLRIYVLFFVCWLFFTFILRFHRDEANTAKP
jgi:hypothetical protein